MTTTSYNVYQQITSVRLATTSNLAGNYFNGSLNNGVGATLTAQSVGALVVDGVNVDIGDRLLLKNQTNTVENGLYVVQAKGGTISLWLLERAPDFQSLEQLKVGQYFSVGAGNTLSGSMYVLVEPLPSVVGLGTFNFVDVSNSGSIVGPYLLKSANLSDLSNNEQGFANLGLGSGNDLIIDEADFSGGLYILTNPCPNLIFVNATNPGNAILLPFANGSESFLPSQGPIFILQSGFEPVEIQDSSGAPLVTINSPSCHQFVLTNNSTSDGVWYDREFTITVNNLSGDIKLTSVDGSVTITPDSSTGTIDFSITSSISLTLQSAYDNGTDAIVDLTSNRPIIFENSTNSISTNSVSTASTGSNIVANNRVLGWTFIPSINMSVNALQYDVALYPGGSSRQTGIYLKSTQQLLTSALVSNSDPVDLSGNYYTHSLIQPIDLIAGTEYVFATVVPINNPNHNNNDAVPDSNISITQWAVSPGTSSPIPLSYPTTFNTLSNLVQVGSFQYEIVSPKEQFEVNDFSTGNQFVEISSIGASRPALSVGRDETNPLSGYGVYVSATRNLQATATKDWFHFFEAFDSSAAMTQYGALACKVLVNTAGAVAGQMNIGAAIPADNEVVPFISCDGQSSLIGLLYDVEHLNADAITGDTIRNYSFTAPNSSGSPVNYVNLQSFLSDNTVGTEDGLLNIQVQEAGTLTTYIQLLGGVSTIGMSKPSIYSGLLNINSQNLVNVGNITTAASPDASSQLQLTATGKGSILNPQTTAQFAAISSPATGLLAYDTDKLRYTSWNGSSVKDIAYTTDINGQSGTYVPTFTAASGGNTFTLIKALYSAQSTSSGSVVDVVLQFTYVATAGSAAINISLPINTTFSSTGQAAIVGGEVYGAVPAIGDGLLINVDTIATQTSVVATWIVATSIGTKTVNLSFSYQIQ